MAVTNMRSGKTGRVTYGGVNLKVKKWTCADKAQNLDATHFESSGHGEYLGGVVDQDVTIEFDVEVGVFPFGTSLMAAGGTYSTTLTEDTATALTSWVGSLIVDSINSTVDVRGTVSGSLQGKFTGTPTRPTA